MNWQQGALSSRATMDARQHVTPRAAMAYQMRDCGILLSPLPRRLLHVLHIGRHPASSISDPPLLSGVAWSTVSAGWPHHMHWVCLARYALALRRYALWLRGSLMAYLLCHYPHGRVDSIQVVALMAWHAARVVVLNLGAVCDQLSWRVLVFEFVWVHVIV